MSFRAKKIFFQVYEKLKKLLHFRSFLSATSLATIQYLLKIVLPFFTYRKRLLAHFAELCFFEFSSIEQFHNHLICRVLEPCASRCDGQLLWDNTKEEFREDYGLLLHFQTRAAGYIF